MKILYVTTISDTMGFFTSHIEMLLEDGHTVDMACNIGKAVNQDLLNKGCNVFDIGFQRAPLKKENYKAYKKLKQLILDENYDLVHTHTPIASVIVRLACREMKNVKVMYTAHGFHFFKGAPLKNWLIYYPIERWLSRYTDILITINKEDYSRAKKLFKAKDIKYIPGVGLDTKKFQNVNINKQSKRKEIGIQDNALVILSVGELNSNKNHETIIKAISSLNKKNIYYIICGQGPLEYYLRDLANELGLNENIRLLGYRNDIDEIYKLADIFAFPSRREGLGMAALEAMASGLPLITSNVHGIVDYSIDGRSGFTCNPNDINSFSMGIEKLLYDSSLRKRISEHNVEAVKKFDSINVINQMQKLYNDIANN